MVLSEEKHDGISKKSCFYFHRSLNSTPDSFNVDLNVVI